MNLAQHLPVLPVLIPLLTGAVLLLLSDQNRSLRTAIALTASFLQLLTAIAAISYLSGILDAPWQNAAAVYTVGNWPAPFGIVLVLDRLAAAMLLLTAILGLAALVYALPRWAKSGVHFLSLFQFLLMGINGAFLTGDLFNLFVFFEILLTASYGLVMHGSGAPRVKAGLHYVAINLVASFVFLIAIAIIYGVTGTLNMADIAQKLSSLTGQDKILFNIAAFMLGMVFLVKAGAWPLNFWLTPSYSAAAAPVAAICVILTKVGIYSLVRFTAFFPTTESPTPFGGGALFYCGILTIAAGTAGTLAAQQLTRLAAYCIIVSSGILLCVIGMSAWHVAGAALFYLCSSVLAGGAFFMLIELAERNRAAAADLLAVSFEAFGLQDPSTEEDEPEEVVGIAIPASMAFLGLAFVSCALLLSGLPPLSGFVGKLLIIDSTLNSAAGTENYFYGWLLIAAVILSGLAALLAFVRIGIRVFWSTERIPPKLHVLEAGSISFLILATVGLVFAASPLKHYFDKTVYGLITDGSYIRAVFPENEPAAPEP